MDDVLAEIQRLRSMCSLTEQELLEPIRHPFDRPGRQEWLDKGTYLTYHAIGQYFQPTSIAEIGSRYGYSLHAMTVGSLRVKRIYSFDMELDFQGSCDYIRDHFNVPGVELTVVKINTQKFSSLSQWISGHVDLFHVDGDHSARGAYHDCMLAWRYVAPGGILLIDDVDNGYHVKLGADKFCREARVTPIFIPCYRGLYAIRKEIPR